MSAEVHRLRYRRRLVSWSLAACSGLFLLIGVSGLTNNDVGGGPFLFFCVLTAIALFLVVRTFRMATLIADANSILIRGFLRSRRIRLSAIDTVEALDKPNMYGMGGKTIAIKTSNGRTITAGEFWSTTSSSGTNRMDTMALELNDWCRKQRPEAGYPDPRRGGGSGDDS
jgi:hypothetical protein